MGIGGLWVLLVLGMLFCTRIESWYLRDQERKLHSKTYNLSVVMSIKDEIQEIEKEEKNVFPSPYCNQLGIRSGGSLFLYI